MADDMRHMELPGHFPPVRGLVGAQDGAVWVEEATTQTPFQRWRWFDLRNGTSGAVSVPAQFTLVDVLAGQSWGYEANADGIHSVIQYSIGLRHLGA